MFIIGYRYLEVVFALKLRFGDHGIRQRKCKEIDLNKLFRGRSNSIQVKSFIFFNLVPQNEG